MTKYGEEDPGRKFRGWFNLVAAERRKLKCNGGEKRKERKSGWLSRNFVGLLVANTESLPRRGWGGRGGLVGAVNEGCWTCHPVESIEGHRISLCTERCCTPTRYRHPVMEILLKKRKKKESVRLRNVTLLLPQAWQLEWSIGNHVFFFWGDF